MKANSLTKSDSIPWRRHLKGAFISGVIVYIILQIAWVYVGQPLTWKYLLLNFTLTMLYNVSIYMANIAFAVYLADLLEKQLPKSFSVVTKFIIGVMLSLVITTITVVVINVALGLLVWGQTVWEAIVSFGFEFWLIYWGITLIIALFVHGIEMVKQLQASEEREKQLLTDYHNARYKAIKGQLNPHFLFNSLSVLSSLIEESPENAQSFIQGLSRIYRYVLEHHEKDWVPLSIELRFAKDYLQLLKMRFEEGFEYRIDIRESEAETMYVIPLSLQILLENVVKHNVIQPQKPVTIHIRHIGSHIIVSNTYQPKSTTLKSTKIGLQNIRKRYQQLTGQDITVTTENGMFSVQLPLRKDAD